MQSKPHKRNQLSTRSTSFTEFAGRIGIRTSGPWIRIRLLHRDRQLHILYSTVALFRDVSHVLCSQLRDLRFFRAHALSAYISPWMSTLHSRAICNNRAGKDGFAMFIVNTVWMAAKWFVFTFQCMEYETCTVNKFLCENRNISMTTM